MRCEYLERCWQVADFFNAHAGHSDLISAKGRNVMLSLCRLLVRP